MNLAAEILVQTFRNIWAHKLRSLLTMFGISWGIASIVFMMGIGDGFKAGYRKMLYALGTDVVIVWGGRTSKQAGDQRAGREIRLEYSDVQAIRQECFHIRHATPELARSLSIRSAFNAGLFSTHGVAPIYQEIRSMVLDRGRHLSEEDFLQERPVCVIGEAVRKQLFADRSSLGETIRILNLPFTVVGLLAKKEQNNSYNGMDENKVLIPYSTMAKYFPDPRPVVGPGRIDNIIFMPVSPEVHTAAVRQLRGTLARRHGFEPSDEGAIWIWDTVEQAQMVSGIYDSMQIFLAVVALVTLALGGVGVMNIMLVSVSERTREIGLKKAIGAKSRRILLEFFLEAVALTMVSGLAGLGFAWAVSMLMARLPLPTLFAGLPISATTASLAFGTLVAVGILSAIYPARRAASMTPVEALRCE